MRNSYDCWLVNYRHGVVVEVRSERNIHEALFIANAKVGNRHRSRTYEVPRDTFCSTRRAQ